MHRRLTPAPLLGLIVFAGCQAQPALRDEPPPAAPLAAAFKAKTTGTIAGRVTWQGELPTVTPFKAYANRAFPTANQFTGDKPNPRAPHIDRATRGLRGAVVYLRHVEPERARPWDHPPVRVAMRDREFNVEQGDRVVPIGIVRRGTEVEFVNQDVIYHQIKLRGVEFFSLPLVRADTPARRRLDQPGLVELSAGAGQFWMNAFLFVSEHPYYALTDDEGRFRLEQVPAGDYELAAWLPNWHVERFERDPEVGLVSRVAYAPPVTQASTIRVATGQTTQADIGWSAKHFP